MRDGRLGLVVVDYLQLMHVERPTGSRVEDVSELSRGLKRLARELGCPVIAVAQLSRAVEQRPDKRPVLADLRESGQIEADADCVLMLYREDYYDRDSERPGELDVIVRKNRQGRLGQATTRLDRRLRFLPVERQSNGSGGVRAAGLAGADASDENDRQGASRGRSTTDAATDTGTDAATDSRSSLGEGSVPASTAFSGRFGQ